jgi:hypothetical protein
MDKKGNGGASKPPKSSKSGKSAKPAKAIWAYAYEIVPPQSEERLHEIRTLIDAEHTVAKQRARTWRGKVVLKEEVTHILVVSDSEQQNEDINHRLEAVFKQLNVGYSLTAPMSVADEDAGWRAPPRLKGVL